MAEQMLGGNSFEKRENNPQRRTKKAEKIIQGQASIKQNTGRRIWASLISGDLPTTKDSILFDVVLPAIKKGIFDIITSGIEILLYGEANHGSRSKTPFSKVSYSNFYGFGKEREYRSTYSQNTSFGKGDVVVSTRSDAELILSHLSDLVDVYGAASLADLYEMAGISGSYTDNNYGWKGEGSLGGASIQRIPEGYLIKLPPARPLGD